MNPPNASQGGNKVFRDPVSEVLILGAAAHILERQHGDRGPVGERKRLWLYGAWCSKHGRREAHRVRSHRLVNVFDLLLTEVRVRQRQSLADVPVSRARDRYPAWLCQALKPGRYVHAVAEQITSPDHHITNVDADPEPKLPILGCSDAILGQLLLDRDGALDRIDRAQELGQDAIASGIGNSASVIANQPIHDLASGSEGTQRPGLVLAHQARIAGNVRNEDRCQTPFDPLFLLGRHRSPCRWGIVRRKEAGFKGQAGP